MRVGAKKLEDVLINVGNYKKVSSKYGDKTFILKAIQSKDYKTLREISNYFFEAGGIYYNLCNYLAKLYRYDWYVTPFVVDTEKEKEDKILKSFANVLTYLDNSEVKVVCEDAILDMIINGVYYGIILDFNDKFGLQDLPADYCRTRYTQGTLPIVELNLKFFDDCFTNVQYRIQVLKMFPKDIQHAYVQFKENKLKGDYPGDTTFWYPLDPETTVCLTLNKKQFPPFVGVIPSLIDLDQAQDLDKKKTLQQLLKILVQKLPLDKNGDMIFDMDEAKDIHSNAVQMLKRAEGVDVLTTFADIQAVNTRDNNSTTTKDDLEKVERTVFNNAGISRDIFNADGNLALTNAILVDEASVRRIPLKLATLLTRTIQKFNKKNHYTFRVEVLETTQFNYKEISKMFKEQTSMGFSKMLPQIALGISQSSILATLTFENEILHLADIMIPPMLSSTRSERSMGNGNQTNDNKTQNNQTEEKKSAGRPEKPDSEKSDKTIANKESEG